MTRAQKIIETIKNLKSDAYSTQQDKCRRLAMHNLIQDKTNQVMFSMRPPNEPTSKHRGGGVLT